MSSNEAPKILTESEQAQADEYRTKILSSMNELALLLIQQYALFRQAKTDAELQYIDSKADTILKNFRNEEAKPIDAYLISVVTCLGMIYEIARTLPCFEAVSDEILKPTDRIH